MFSNETINSASIPIIMLRNLVPVPNVEMKVDISGTAAKDAVRAATNGNKYVAIMTVKNPVLDAGMDNIYPVGVICRVLLFMDGQVSKCRFLGVVRCKIETLEQTEPYYTGLVTSIPKYNKVPYIKPKATATINLYDANKSAIAQLPDLDEVTLEKVFIVSVFIIRPKPKSPSLKIPSLVIKIFAGFKSR